MLLIGTVAIADLAGDNDGPPTGPISRAALATLAVLEGPLKIIGLAVVAMIAVRDRAEIEPRSSRDLAEIEQRERLLTVRDRGWHSISVRIFTS
jgi:hypothetical protein